MREGLGYLYGKDGRIYCGQFRQDNEEGVGEYLTVRPTQNLFTGVDFQKHEMIRDKINKICQQLKPLGGIVCE
jgi:hypothetical protein